MCILSCKCESFSTFPLKATLWMELVDQWLGNELPFSAFHMRAWGLWMSIVYIYICIYIYILYIYIYYIYLHIYTLYIWYIIITFFPTCQVRVVRFYLSCLLLLLLLSSSSRRPLPLVVLLLSLSSSSRCPPRPPAQLRLAIHSVRCRTSTTTIHAQCSLPDLNREYPRQKICHIECQKICQIEC